MTRFQVSAHPQDLANYPHENIVPAAFEEDPAHAATISGATSSSSLSSPLKKVAAQRFGARK
jgi:hypothetical protein